MINKNIKIMYCILIVLIIAFVHTSSQVDNINKQEVSTELVKITGNAYRYKDSLFIIVKIKNNLGHSIAVSLNEWFFYIDKQRIMEIIKWENRTSPSSRIMVFDNDIKYSSNWAHSDENRIYNKLPKLLIIDDSVNLIIKKKILQNEDSLISKNKKLFIVLYYAKFNMLLEFMDTNHLDYYKSIISNWEISDSGPKKISSDFKYEINLPDYSRNNFYSSGNCTNILLKKQQATFLGILFMNWATCEFDVDFN